ncbi:MAG: hypothetical protein H6668_05875 [Ardenticatenaceae bacterium]|nr:hypothetical protein [Ardenticatenaceae bacterium]
MKNDPVVTEKSRGKWPTNLILTGSVILTVLMGLFMAQLDTLFVHDGLPQESFFPVTLLPIIGSLGDTPTATPFPTIALPTETATPPPASPTATPDSSVPQTPTAVAMLPTCGQIPAGWVAYVVRPGDTLFALAPPEPLLTKCARPTVRRKIRPFTRHLPFTCSPRAAAAHSLLPAQLVDALYGAGGRHHVLIGKQPGTTPCCHERQLAPAAAICGRQTNHLPPLAVPPPLPMYRFTATNTAKTRAIQHAAPGWVTNVPPTATATLPHRHGNRYGDSHALPHCYNYAIRHANGYPYRLRHGDGTNGCSAHLTNTATLIPPTPTHTATPVPQPQLTQLHLFH